MEGVGEEVEPGNEPAAAAAAGGCGLRGAGSPAGLCRISSEAWPLEVMATEEREFAWTVPKRASSPKHD